MTVCVLGSLNLDVVCTVAELPAPGETVPGLRVSRFPGGKGLNQAVAAARWGARTAMIGAVGDDEAGRELLIALTEAGVDATGIAIDRNVQSGQAFLFVSKDGENMIVVVGGANIALASPGHFDLERGDVVLAQLETSIEVTHALFVTARKAGSLALLNAAPAVDSGAALFPLADIVIVNEVELGRYAGAAAAPTRIDDVASLARRLLCREGQKAVVTLASAGAAAIDAEAVNLVPGRPAKVVDTTGAGDCFCGVLAAELSLGASLAMAMDRATAAAALSTETHGAAVSMPTRERVTNG